jgi:hypothetical protein
MGEEALAEAFLARLLDEDGPPPAVDWERYRLMQLIPGTAGVSDLKMREALVARGFVELAKGTFDAETERRSIISLRALVSQVLRGQPRVEAGFTNPLVASMKNGPGPGTPPNLARLLSAIAEIARSATAVTVVGDEDALGERMMTLLFLDGKYVGFVPASRPTPTGQARA